jgi:hypothetical protein
MIRFCQRSQTAAPARAPVEAPSRLRVCTDRISTSTAASARPRIRSVSRKLAYSALLSALTRAAAADPQVSVGLTAGGGIANLRTTAPLPVFHMGLHGDVLFLRNKDRDMAIGPYVEVLTVAFETAEMGAGVSWLIPLGEHFPLTLSLGGHARAYPVYGGMAWEPGVDTTIFFGTRSYNFNSVYGLAAGIFVQGRLGLGDGHQADVLAGAQLDLELFVLPFVLLVNAFR